MRRRRPDRHRARRRRVPARRRGVAAARRHRVVVAGRSPSRSRPRSASSSASRPPGGPAGSTRWSPCAPSDGHATRVVAARCGRRSGTQCRADAVRRLTRVAFRHEPVGCRCPGTTRSSPTTSARAPAEPGPGRPDHAAGPRARACSTCPTCAMVRPEPADDDAARPRARRRTTSRRYAGSAPTRTQPDLGARARHRRQPVFAGHARGVRARRRAPRRGGPRGLDRRGRARRQHRRRAAPRDARRGQRASASTTTRRSRSPGCSTQGAERVAYVDVDVHHGDGVRAGRSGTTPGADDLAARERAVPLPRHRLPRRRRAAPAPRATAVNVALPPGTGDAGWLRAFHAVVPPLLAEFRPQVLVTPARLRQPRPRPAGPPGPHASTPSARRTPRCTTSRTSYAGGRWVATGGGGYELVEVVPRAWTHLIAEAAGRPARPAHRRCRRTGGSTCASAGRAGAAPG